MMSNEVRSSPLILKRKRKQFEIDQGLQHKMDDLKLLEEKAGNILQHIGIFKDL